MTRTVALFAASLTLAACASDDPAASDTAVDLSTTAWTDGGTYEVSWSSEPAPVPFNEPFTVRFDVPGAGDDPAYTLDVTMPAHGHGMQVEPLLTAEPDALVAEGLIFHMDGLWSLTLTVDDDAGPETAAFWIDCCE